MGAYAPQYPPPYYVPPPRSDSGKIILIIVVVVLVAIAVPVILGAILYFMVSGLLTPPPPTPQVMGISLSQQGTNWSAVITGTPSGKLPSSTFLVIRDSQGGIVLPTTAFSSLNWPSHRAVYRDANPTVAEIRVPDGIVMDASTYPAGDTMQISDGQNILIVMALR